MKRKIIKVISLCVAIGTLGSCGNKNVLKTEEFSDKLTQTSVVLQSTLSENEDYKDFLKEFSPSFTVPGLLEGIIPQGICFIEKLNMFVISGYYEEGVFPSMLIFIDAESGKLIKASPLQDIGGEDYCGHAGGIAASENHIYITGEGTCRILSVDSIENSKNGERLRFESNFKLTTDGAFACYNDGVLWCGDFIESSESGRKNARKITTLSSGETFYAYCEGYILKDGIPIAKNINSQANGYIPDYILAIPEQVQGMAFTNSGKIIFSTSYGRRADSKIYVYDDVFSADKVGIYTVDESKIGILACGSDLLKETFTAPPMAEGIVRKDNAQFLIFESGAEKYRNHRGKYTTDTAFTVNIE